MTANGYDGYNVSRIRSVSPVDDNRNDCSNQLMYGPQYGINYNDKQSG